MKYCKQFQNSLLAPRGPAENEARAGTFQARGAERNQEHGKSKENTPTAAVY